MKYKWQLSELGYHHPIFNDPKNNWIVSDVYDNIYEGKIDYSQGLCPNAEYVVPRMLNTVISPIENERIQKYAVGLGETVKHFLN